MQQRLRDIDRNFIFDFNTGKYILTLSPMKLSFLLMKTYILLGGGVSADLSPMPKSHLAIVPSQEHVSLMMQTKPILGYMNDFLK
jgi:hypothetical protein